MLKKPSDYVKIKITVPVKAAAKIRRALGQAGAGIQGNYQFTSFSTSGVGRFKPMSGAKPAIGKIGKLEHVKEEMIETICHKKLIKKVIAAVKKSHPYEEPAIDIMLRYEL